MVRPIPLEGVPLRPARDVGRRPGRRSARRARRDGHPRSRAEPVGRLTPGRSLRRQQLVCRRSWSMRDRAVLGADRAGGAVRLPARAGEEATQTVVLGEHPPAGVREAVRPQRVRARVQQPRPVPAALGRRVDPELVDLPVLARLGVDVRRRARSSRNRRAGRRPRPPPGPAGGRRPGARSPAPTPAPSPVRPPRRAGRRRARPADRATRAAGRRRSPPPRPARPAVRSRRPERAGAPGDATQAAFLAVVHAPVAAAARGVRSPGRPRRAQAREERRWPRTTEQSATPGRQASQQSGEIEGVSQALTGRMLMAAVVSAISALLYGYDTGIISGRAAADPT